MIIDEPSRGAVIAGDLRGQRFRQELSRRLSAATPSVRVIVISRLHPDDLQGSPMAEPELEVVDTSDQVRELSAEQQDMLMAAAKKRDRGEPLTDAETALLADWEKPFPVDIRKDDA